MSEYHEPENELTPLDRDFHRALASVREEIEAVDWYHQRVIASTNDELKKVMAHNRDEEIEHACMGLEWLRRNMPMWDKHMRTYLFTTDPITEVEKNQEAADNGETGGSTDSGLKELGVGSLKDKNITTERK